MPRRRKQKITFNDPGHAHFLTYSCQHRWPLLSRDSSRQWLIDAIRDARASQRFELWAYVIMPEHAHLLLCPERADYRMANIHAAIKRPVAAKAKAWLIESDNRAWLDKLSVRDGGGSVFRFWLPGGGYDRNLWSERPMEDAIDYIHANPVRRGLVENVLDWPWSSARFWAGQRPAPLEMDVPPL